MRLVETFSSMKDIDIGLQDGDPAAMALAQKLSNTDKQKYQIIYDPSHQLFYGFNSYGLSDSKTTSSSYYKYMQYCKAHKYPRLGYQEFSERLKVVNADEFRKEKAGKGTRFKEL